MSDHIIRLRVFQNFADMADGELRDAILLLHDYDALAARLAEAERLLSIKVPAGGINVNGVHIGKGCDLRTVASAIEGPRAAASASVDYEQEELERMLKQESKAHAAASADVAPRCSVCGLTDYGPYRPAFCSRSDCELKTASTVPVLPH